MALTAPDQNQLVVPADGFVPYPEVPQPNIFPMEWRVETPKLAELYERAKRHVWNPSDFPWDTLRAEDFTEEQRLGIMYWYAVLGNFDGSGSGGVAQATRPWFQTHP